MRPTIVLAFMILHHFVCQSQNIVLNRSLEDYATCPGFGQFSSTYIDDWDKPSYGSTDYYHYNCPGIIPVQQVPRTGNAYAGIIGYNYGQEYREYMTGTLSTPLIPGATYFCEFYVSLNDGYIQAIKELGAYFSVAPPGPFTNTLHIAVTPQVQNTTVLLDDTATWMRVSGYFLASGGEQYITIGNFNNDSNTTIMQVGNSGSYGSYYFVDDVWVSLSEGLGIESAEALTLKIFPNPVNDKCTIGLPFHNVREPLIVTLYNVAGQVVLERETIDTNEIQLNVESLSIGYYLAEIFSEGKIFRSKFLKF